MANKNIFLELKLLQSEIPAGESIDIIITLTNISDRTRELYGISPEENTLEFEIKDEFNQSRIVSYADSVQRQGEIHDIHAEPEKVKIESGMKIGQEYQLYQMTGYLKPGNYMVRALYVEGYAKSEWQSFQITEPRTVREIYSTWDFDRTAFSHIVSVAAIPTGGGKKKLNWLEEHENTHTFFFHNHPLMDVSDNTEPFLSHTLTYLQPSRHLIWFEAKNRVTAHLINNGKLGSESKTIISPVPTAQILAKAFTESDNRLILFALASSPSLDIQFWTGRESAQGHINWIKLVEQKSKDLSISYAGLKTFPKLEISFDAVGKLHALIALDDKCIFYYYRWNNDFDLELFLSDSYVHRNFIQGFFHHHWEEEQFPPNLITDFWMLFKNIDHKGRWDLWNYTFDSDEKLIREQQGRFINYPEPLNYIKSQLDLNSRLFIMWERNGYYYYSNFQNPLVESLQRKDKKFYPVFYLNSFVKGDEHNISCRYLERTGEYNFYNLKDPYIPRMVLESKADTCIVDKIFEMTFGIINEGSTSILLRDPRDIIYGLKLYVEKLDGSEPNKVFTSESISPDLNSLENRGDDQKISIPAGRFGIFKSIQDRTEDLLELDSESEQAFSLLLPLNLTPGQYKIYLRWEWLKADTNTIFVSVFGKG